MNKIVDQHFEKERELYNIKNTEILNCNFIGKTDGESPLKECSNITVNKCNFSLRYPLWLNNNFNLVDSIINEPSRAPIWYCKNGYILNTKCNSVKALRECSNIKILDSIFNSEECCWRCHKLSLKNISFMGPYFFFESQDSILDKINLVGKYSFQYCKNLTLSNCNLDTKDAFWHAKNIIIKDSIIQGEYLGWFSENLTFINCKIMGTQPLCYCKNLKLINCTMINTYLAFEYSKINATILNKIKSIKNPLKGKITLLEGYEELILEDSKYKCRCKIINKERK